MSNAENIPHRFQLGGDETVGRGLVSLRWLKPADAQEVCGAIRKEVAALYDEATAESVRIQYGGSVKSGNVVQIMDQPDIDGCLVGGASLQPEEFAAIVCFYQL